MALPPYFTTMIFRLNRWIYGSVRMELYLAEIIGYIESA